MSPLLNRNEQELSAYRKVGKQTCYKTLNPPGLRPSCLFFKSEPRILFTLHTLCENTQHRDTARN